VLTDATERAKKVYLREQKLKDATAQNVLSPTPQTRDHECEKYEVRGKCGINAGIDVMRVAN